MLLTTSKLFLCLYGGYCIKVLQSPLYFRGSKLLLNIVVVPDLYKE